MMKNNVSTNISRQRQSFNRLQNSRRQQYEKLKQEIANKDYSSNKKRNVLKAVQEYRDQNRLKAAEELANRPNYYGQATAPFRTKGVTIGGRTKPKASTSSALMSLFHNKQTQSSSNIKRPVGRPKGILKYKSPFSGKPIPAQQFYAEMRRVKRIQESRIEQAQIAQLQRQAARPPQPVQRPQQPVPQQVQQIQRLPTSVTQPTIWKRQAYVAIERDPWTNQPKQVIRGVPESMWN